MTTTTAMPRPTRADRLHRCLAALSPARVPNETGDWGPQGAPYSILTLPSGRIRVTIWDHESGDLWVGAGATLDDALTALEAKVLPATPPAESAPVGGS